MTSSHLVNSNKPHYSYFLNMNGSHAGTDFKLVPICSDCQEWAKWAICSLFAYSLNPFNIVMKGKSLAQNCYEFSATN